MTSAAWQNLALAALLTCYLLQIGLEVSWRNTCGHLAIDYCAFWSAGRVANTSGYASIYDLSMLQRVEASISPPSTTYAFAVSPIAYLPVFIIPFQFLAKLEPVPSYWLWAIANILVLALYLRFFVREVTGSEVAPALQALSLLSLPVYLNLFDGQVNVWLVICVGEALRASLAGRMFRSGMWLAGLLLKPQLLVLILPMLVWKRAFKMLGGLGSASLGMLAASWLMIGGNGFGRLLQLWLGFGYGMPTNDVGIMMNWRMLGSTVGAVSSPMLGWILIVAGSAFTVAGAMYLWRRDTAFQSGGLVVAWMGVLAATMLFTWHSHVHSAMILLPALLTLGTRKAIPEKIIRQWVMLPAGLYFAAFLVAAGIQKGLLPATAAPATDFARGAGEFGMSIYLLGWAMQRLRSTTTEPRLAAGAESTSN